MTGIDLPLVTFYVKAYRQEQVVHEAVASAFAQTYPNLEIILSDDASPDGTFRVMEEMAAAYDGPHSVHLNRNPTNLGIVGHSNRLWSMASGRLFSGCAGDDIAEPHKVARLVEAWRAGEGRVTAIHSRVTKIDAEGQVIGPWAPRPDIVEDASPLNLARTMANAIGATILYDRRIIDRFGLLPDFCEIEDGPMFFRAALLGEIAYVDEPLVRYRVGGISDPQSHGVSPGWQYIRGHRMTAMSWRVSNAKSFINDMSEFDFPEREECLALCRAEIERNAFEVALWRASPLQRLAMLPEALRRSLASRSGRALREAMRHLLGPFWIARYDLLQRRAAAKQAP